MPRRVSGGEQDDDGFSIATGDDSHSFYRDLHLAGPNRRAGDVLDSSFSGHCPSDDSSVSDYSAQNDSQGMDHLESPRTVGVSSPPAWTVQTPSDSNGNVRPFAYRDSTIGSTNGHSRIESAGSWVMTNKPIIGGEFSEVQPELKGVTRFQATKDVLKNKLRSKSQ